MKFHVSSWNSEILYFDRLLLSKSCKVSAEKVQKSYLSWHWRVMQSLKLTCGFKYDLRNLVNSHPTTKSENFTWAFPMGSFCPKYIKYELKKYRRVIFRDNKQWCKIWINPDLAVSLMPGRIGWIFIRALESLKNCTLMGCFCSKLIMFKLESFRGLMCHETEM